MRVIAKATATSPGLSTRVDGVSQSQPVLASNGQRTAEPSAGMVDALEALTTACEWFGQREAGEPTTNAERAIFQRLSNVAARLDGESGLGLPPSDQGGAS